MSKWRSATAGIILILGTSARASEGRADRERVDPESSPRMAWRAPSAGGARAEGAEGCSACAGTASTSGPGAGHAGEPREADTRSRVLEEQLQRFLHDTWTNG